MQAFISVWLEFTRAACDARQQIATENFQEAEYERTHPARQLARELNKKHDVTLHTSVAKLINYIGGSEGAAIRTEWLCYVREVHRHEDVFPTFFHCHPGETPYEIGTKRCIDTFAKVTLNNLLNNPMYNAIRVKEHIKYPEHLVDLANEMKYIVTAKKKEVHRLAKANQADPTTATDASDFVKRTQGIQRTKSTVLASIQKTFDAYVSLKASIEARKALEKHARLDKILPSLERCRRTHDQLKAGHIDFEPIIREATLQLQNAMQAATLDLHNKIVDMEDVVLTSKLGDLKMQVVREQIRCKTLVDALPASSMCRLNAVTHQVRETLQFVKSKLASDISQGTPGSAWGLNPEVIAGIDADLEDTASFAPRVQEEQIFKEELKLRIQATCAEYTVAMLEAGVEVFLLHLNQSPLDTRAAKGAMLEYFTVICPRRLPRQLAARMNSSRLYEWITKQNPNERTPIAALEIGPNKQIAVDTLVPYVAYFDEFEKVLLSHHYVPKLVAVPPVLDKSLFVEWIVVPPVWAELVEKVKMPPPSKANAEEHELWGKAVQSTEPVPFSLAYDTLCTVCRFLARMNQL